MQRKRFPDTAAKRCAGAVLCCLSGFSLPAAASAELALQLETSLASDSNPFRFYDGAAQELQHGNPARADAVAGLDLRAGAILPVWSERTRLILTGSLGRHHYKNYAGLDHQPRGADATLEWAAGQSLSGRLGAGKEDRLFQYINGNLTERDLSHQTHAGAELTWQISPDWSLPLKWNKSVLTYDLAVNQLYNFEEGGRQAGLRYLSPTGSSLEAGWRMSSTDFPDRDAGQVADFDRRYRESESYLDSEWKYSVKTVASAHLGMIRRRYQSKSELDTNLFNALLRATYFYSPKLRLDLQLWDRPFSIVDRSILYVVAKGARFDAQWKWSDKTQLNLSGLTQDSDQVLVPRLASLADGVSRQEKLQRLGLGAHYQLERGLKLTLDSFYEKAERESDRLQIRQAVVKLGLEYTYENLPGSAAKMGLTRYQHSLSASDALR